MIVGCSLDEFMIMSSSLLSTLKCNHGIIPLGLAAYMCAHGTRGTLVCVGGGGGGVGGVLKEN